LGVKDLQRDTGREFRILLRPRKLGKCKTDEIVGALSKTKNSKMQGLRRAFLEEKNLFASV